MASEKVHAVPCPICRGTGAEASGDPCQTCAGDGLFLLIPKKPTAFAPFPYRVFSNFSTKTNN